MENGVWVEVAFTGDVSLGAAERFLDGVADYAKRYGLRIGVATAHDTRKSPWPGTWLMLDAALQELADAAGVSVAEVQARLEDKARAQLTPAALT